MLDNYRDLIDELLGTPTTLRGLLGDRRQPVPPAVAGLVAELRDRDQAVRTRLQTMTREANPYLRSFPPAVATDEADVEALLDGFDVARGELVSLLMNLTLRDWERTAIHEVDGELTLADEVERHVEFDEDQVRRIRRATTGGAGTGA